MKPVTTKPNHTVINGATTVAYHGVAPKPAPSQKPPKRVLQNSGRRGCTGCGKA